MLGMTTASSNTNEDLEEDLKEWAKKNRITQPILDAMKNEG